MGTNSLIPPSLLLLFFLWGSRVFGDTGQADPLQYLIAGNEHANAGRHAQAIAQWQEAARLRPDSNVPWNNMANSYMAMGMEDEAYEAAKHAAGMLVDHMTSVTYANILRKRKNFRAAEEALIAGINYTRQHHLKYEHAFWSLANLYFHQGDMIEFIKYSEMGMNFLSHDRCQPALTGCEIPEFESDIVSNLYNASLNLAIYDLQYNKLSSAGSNLDRASQIAQGFGYDDSLLKRCQACLLCKKSGAAACESQTGCLTFMEFINSPFVRMIPVRVMGCEWRWREEDEEAISRILQLQPEKLLLQRNEWNFECEGGQVCGAGAQPPLHLWGLNFGLQEVRTMGMVQPLEIRGRQEQEDEDIPSWAYPSWSPTLTSRLSIAYISSDLFRDHPVGNMMRAVLPLHDLSRMDVTVFIVHQEQQAAAAEVRNRHLVGDVKVVLLGRGPNVQRKWDRDESVRAADLVNSAGVCILFDLIGYTSDHRQDVLSLRPAPIQVHYHGYIGTTGAPWIDLYMADSVIAPPESAPTFTERLLLLPESFLGPSHRLVHQLWANSGGSKLDFDTLSELDLSMRKVNNLLPAASFVLCNFNQHFKVDPRTFSSWTSVLGNLSSTVLWMLEGTPVSERNLRRELQAAGISSDRLIFARRAAVKDHLRRAALCDLSLDTPNYNSGATGADTLFAGVPILHLPSMKPIGRMMSSMLKALRLEELIVRNHEEYFKLAHRFAQQGSSETWGERAIDKLKTKLLRRIIWSPLFDVSAWVNDFDQMCRTLWDMYTMTRDESTDGADDQQQASWKAMNIFGARPRGLSKGV
uniref:protein O-GlcNAc transferase n=1 Tax=Hanusia phi TaxID=3032 RepID=A0A7S0NDZ6_9CRYP|mmetsp:Transcript_7717/g.17624  ORF Transcript_7717/g.17624 Transcript_7717/m.17624 type:complete len:808 (+) Transcript_7717:33-2456(+)